MNDGCANCGFLFSDFATAELCPQCGERPSIDAGEAGSLATPLSVRAAMNAALLIAAGSSLLAASMAMIFLLIGIQFYADISFLRPWFILIYAMLPIGMLAWAFAWRRWMQSGPFSPLPNRTLRVSRILFVATLVLLPALIIHPVTSQRTLFGMLALAAESFLMIIVLAQGLLGLSVRPLGLPGRAWHRRALQTTAAITCLAAAAQLLNAIAIRSGHWRLDLATFEPAPSMLRTLIEAILWIGVIELFFGSVTFSWFGASAWCAYRRLRHATRQPLSTSPSLSGEVTP